MNYRITDDLNNALKNAKEIARLYASPEIGTEHILFGIIQTEESVGARVLSRYGVDERYLAEVFESSPHLAVMGDIDFTARIKNNFESAQGCISALGKSAIGTEHFLYAMLLDETSYASTILRELYLVNIPLLMDDIKSAIERDEEEDYYEDDYIEPSYQKTNKTNSPSQIPATLEGMGIDITQKARENKIETIVGRREEIERIIQILCRKTKNNPVLIGEPGVGKSAVVEGLAKAIIEGDVPPHLLNKSVFSLDIASLVAGTKYRGALEEKLKGAIDAVREDGNIILFIDEIHTLAQAGAKEGEVSPADILKPYLARGELQTVGATTIDEYRKYIEKDKALERRFQPVTVNPPSVEETIEIIKGIRANFEKFHGVTLLDEAIISSVKLSDRYITDRFLPDKAIDLVDEAMSKAKVTHVHGDISVGEEEIAEIVSKWTGVPVTKLSESETERLMNMEKILHGRVIGQDEAIVAVSKSIRRARAGLKDPSRPIGSFLFLGPTGVGKTELTKALGEALFDDENSVVRIDMSEYMEAHAVSKLIGAPPGYQGFEEGGQLTEAVRRKPYTVVLFDEIEKAHPDVFNLLLQLLDDGRLTDSQGRLVSFKNAVIIMTSNAGISELKNSPLGFGNFDARENEKQILSQALKKYFKPELLNRIDVICYFHSLTRENIGEIAGIMLDKFAKTLSNRGYALEITPEALEYIVDKGYDIEYGARPLRRVIEQEMEDAVAECIISGRKRPGDTVTVTLYGGEIKII